MPPFHWWRTVFWLIPTIAIYTIVLGTLSLGSSLFETRGYFGHWCARTWSWLILATTGVRVQVHGLERLERGKTYVFVANHQSIYDIPVVFTAFPQQLRIIAKASLGAFPFLGWHLSRTGHLLVDRRKVDPRAVFNWANGLTANGLSLIVFPEGTRSQTGRVGPFKGGSLYPAVQAGLPIVPISIAGSRHVMRKGRLMTCPGEVELVVHEPIPTVAADEPNIREVRALAMRVRDIIAPVVEEEAARERTPNSQLPNKPTPNSQKPTPNSQSPTPNSQPPNSRSETDHFPGDNQTPNPTPKSTSKIQLQQQHREGTDCQKPTYRDREASCREAGPQEPSPRTTDLSTCS